MLQYHDKSFENLNEKPRVRADRDDVLSKIESRIRRPLPPSLREWYSLESACRFIGDHIPLCELGGPLESESRPCDLVKSDLLPIVVHSEGFGIWAVVLDGSDDPPVLVDPDAHLKSWFRYADHFSQFVLARVFDQLLLGELMAQAELTVPDTALGYMREHFRPQVTTTGWGYEYQHRFEDEGIRIRIDASEGEGLWWLAARSESHFRSLFDRLRRIDGLVRKMYTDDPVAERIIEGR